MLNNHNVNHLKNKKKLYNFLIENQIEKNIVKFKNERKILKK